SAPQGNWVGTYGDSGYDLSFFQAESDIRSLTVTGVQTGALPIYLWGSNTADMRELESTDRSTRVAATYYDANEIQVQLRFSSACTGELTFDLQDEDYVVWRHTITITEQNAYI